jgi:hypothetical protein
MPCSMSTYYRLPHVNLKFWRLCGKSLYRTRIDVVEAGCLDFPAIVTGKEDCLNYYQDNLRLVRPAGLAAIDNPPGRMASLTPASHTRRLG